MTLTNSNLVQDELVNLIRQRLARVCELPLGIHVGAEQLHVKDELLHAERSLETGHRDDARFGGRSGGAA
jgi:hypothetical protein